MRIVLLGTSEAVNETLGNTSALVVGESTILLDCGYPGPFQVWRYNASPDLIDAIYISHAHADDYFGLPPLPVRMPDDGRGKPLTLIGQRHVIEQIWQIDRPRIRGSARRLPFRDRNASKPPRGTKSRIASLLCSSRRAVTRRQITRFE